MRASICRRFGTRGIAAIVFGGALALPSAASAAAPPPLVPIEIVACGDDLPPLVRERLAVELEILWRESTTPPEALSLHTAIRCENEFARLEVTALPEVSRSVVSLNGLDRDARARLLALKATELIHLIGKRTWEKSSSATGEAGSGSSSPEGSPAPGPAAQANSEQRAPADQALGRPVLDRPSESAPLRASATGPSSVSLGAIALLVGRPLTYLVGPALAGQASVVGHMSIGGDIDGLFGSVRDADRALYVRGAAGSAAALYVGNVGAASFAVGAGGRIGLTQLSGEVGPSARVVGRSASGIWAGPMITGKVAYPLGASRWLVELAAEGGMVTLPLAGLVDKSPQFYSLEGPWFGLRASLGLDLVTR